MRLFGWLVGGAFFYYYYLFVCWEEYTQTGWQTALLFILEHIRTALILVDESTSWSVADKHAHNNNNSSNKCKSRLHTDGQESSRRATVKDVVIVQRLRGWPSPIGVAALRSPGVLLSSGTGSRFSASHHSPDVGSDQTAACRLTSGSTRSCLHLCLVLPPNSLFKKKKVSRFDMTFLFLNLSSRGRPIPSAPPWSPEEAGCRCRCWERRRRYSSSSAVS